MRSITKNRQVAGTLHSQGITVQSIVPSRRARAAAYTSANTGGNANEQNAVIRSPPNVAHCEHPTRAVFIESVLHQIADIPRTHKFVGKIITLTRTQAASGRKHKRSRKHDHQNKCRENVPHLFQRNSSFCPIRSARDTEMASRRCANNHDTPTVSPPAGLQVNT